MTHHSHHSIAVAIANEHMWPEAPLGRDTRHRTTPKCDRQVSGHQWVPLANHRERGALRHFEVTGRQYSRVHATTTTLPRCRIAFP